MLGFSGKTLPILQATSFLRRSVIISSSTYAISQPNLVLYNALLKAHSDHRSLFKLSALGSNFLCATISYGLDSSIIVCTTLLDFYGKCKEIGSARKSFDEMPHRNEVSWTAMIVRYLRVFDLGYIHSLFYEMPRRNTVTWNAVIDGCVKCEDLVNAKKLFDGMPKKNSITFTSMIDKYTKVGDMAYVRALFLEGKLGGK